MTHSNTILSQLLSLIQRHVFMQAERKHPTERETRVFSRWNQFVCLSFIHLAARHSMRDGIRNLTVNARKLYHLGSEARGPLHLFRRQQQPASGILPGLVRRDVQAMPSRFARSQIPFQKQTFQSRRIHRQTQP